MVLLPEMSRGFPNLVSSSKAAALKVAFRIEVPQRQALKLCKRSVVILQVPDGQLEGKRRQEAEGQEAEGQEAEGHGATALEEVWQKVLRLGLVSGEGCPQSLRTILARLRHEWRYGLDDWVRLSVAVLLPL